MNQEKEFRVRLQTKPALCTRESIQASSDMIAYQDESEATPNPDGSPPPVDGERSGAAAAAAD